MLASEVDDDSRERVDDDVVVLGEGVLEERDALLDGDSVSL